MSWIITHKKSGEAVLETFSPLLASRINLSKFNVEEAGAYLRRINSEIKARKPPEP